MRRKYSYKLRYRILQLIAMGRHGVIAKRLWNTLTKREKLHSGLFLRMLAAVNFEYRHPRAPYVLKAANLLLDATKINERELNLALFLLVNADCHGLARRLFRRVQTTGKLAVDAPSTLTLNILLGAALRPDRASRGPRQMGKLTRYYKELFIANNVPPDAVTMNMMMKCVLRWQTYDSSYLRKLFNQCIISGYPGWYEPGLPFTPDTDHSSPAMSSMGSATSQQWGDFDLPNAATVITQTSLLSYERHVKPLYKNFIKAFLARDDPLSAQVVIKCLKRAKMKHTAGDRNI